MAHYADSFSVLVSALTRLQDVTGRKSDFLFPKIIAVGNQSSGKSSVIQGLIGREFLPRGSDIVTRCPLNIRVHQTKTDEEYVCFSEEEKYKMKEKKITNFAEVISEIDERTRARVKGTKNVSHEEILLDFFSPKYPDLQFVDLPGFTKISVGDQDKDIEQQVLDLVLTYMRDPNSIILAINDSSQDIAASEALKYAESDDVDPKGERTIGVLTKLDKLEPDSDTQRVINYLENRTKPLALGYIGVVNRSQKQIDDNIDIEKAKETEAEIINRKEFRGIHHRMGIEYLRRFLTVILAQKMKELLPSLRNESIEELRMVSAQLEELGNADDAAPKDYEDLISLLVEKAIKNMRTILHGFTTQVNTEKTELGALMNQKIKQGTVKAAKEARQFYTVEEFHAKLSTGIRNSHAIRDQLMPVELVLDIGVGLLTENYRSPFKNLLEESTRTLNTGLQQTLEATLHIYPKFKDMVMNILLAEVAGNKGKTEEYLDTLLNIHMRVINTEHEEFKKVTQKMRHRGIRFPNVVSWFKEQIPRQEEGVERSKDNEGFEDANSDNDSDNDSDSDVDGTPFEPTRVGRTGLRKVRGFMESLQDNQNSGSSSAVHTIKFPSDMSEEAKFDLDLCLQYMEIIDRQLVDEIPKYYITMLIHRTLDFLEGGLSYKTSLLRQVQKMLSTPEKRADYLIKSHMHEEMVAGLRERKTICQETIKVIEETFDNLNKCS